MMTKIVLCIDILSDEDDDTLQLATRRRLVRRWRRTERLTRSQFRLLSVLACGRRLSKTDLVQALYGERADGGPLSAASCVTAFLYSMRAKLDALGVSIEGQAAQHSFGFFMSLHPQSRPLPIRISRRRVDPIQHLPVRQVAA